MPPRTRRRTSAPIPRKQPLQPRAAVTVDAIVTAVERVLEKHGVDGLTTNRIAEVAGVSIGTLYQYFPNKEALVGAIQERYLEHTFSMCRAALAASDGVPIATVVERMAAALVAAYHVQRPIHRWLIDLRTASDFQDRFRHALDEYVGEVAAFLSARADVHFPDPRATAYLLVHCVEGVVAATGVRREVELDVAAIAAAAISMVSAYVKAHP